MPRASPSADDTDRAGRLRGAILALLASRRPGASICPSEAARAVVPGDGWRDHMGGVRAAARGLSLAGWVEVTQGGVPVDADRHPGPIRIRGRRPTTQQPITTTANRPTMDLDTITEAFDLLDSWDQRFELVSDLGRELIPLDDAERTEANRVPDCDTRAWVVADPHPQDPTRLQFRADAETPLVRGLVALLLMPYQGLAPAEVLALDPRQTFAPLKLDAGLSIKRQAGMEAFFEHLRRLARDARGRP